MGEGCFGRVVLGEAVGVKDSEEMVKTVAVKMIKSITNVAALEALVSELKILIYFIVIIDAQIAHSGPDIEPLSDHIFSTQSDV